MKIADLLVNIAADTKELKTGFKRAEKTVKQSVDKMKKMLLGIAVSYQTINSFKQASEEIDRMAKSATRLNTSVEELQKLQYAADLSGVSFNNLELSMQRMVRRISEAANGTGEAVKALKELNLEASSLQKMTADEQLKILADALKNVTNQSDRVRIAMKLFDTEGVKLLNMLQGGSSQLTKYGNELEKLGLVTTGGAESVEQMNDAFTKISYISKQFWKVLAVKLSPILQDLMSQFTSMNEKSGITKNIMDALTWIFEKLALSVQYIALNMNRLVIAFKAIGAYIDNDDKALNSFIEQMKATNSTADDLLKRLLGFKKFTPTKFTKGFNEAGAGVNNFSTELDNLLKKYQTVSMKQEKLKADMLILSRYFNDGKISLEKYNDVMALMVKQYNNLSKKTNTLSDDVKKLRDAVGTPLENAFMKTFRNMMDGATDFGETMKSMIKDIIAELIRLMVIQDMAKSISGAFFPGTKSSTPTPAPAYAGIQTRGMSSVQSVSAAPITAGSNVVVNNYGTDNVQVKQQGTDIEITIHKIASDILRGKGAIPSALENRYGVSKV